MYNCVFHEHTHTQMHTHIICFLYLFLTHIHARTQTLIQGEEHSSLTIRHPVNLHSLGSLKVMDN